MSTTADAGFKPVLGDDRPLFPGSRSTFTEKLEFVEPDIYDGIPVYRVMDKKGNVIDPSQDPGVSDLVVLPLCNHDPDNNEMEINFWHFSWTKRWS